MTNEWIKDLKAGDKVYIKDENVLTLTTVKKVTPKGSIRTGAGYLFKNGECRVGSWTHTCLRQWTQEFEDKLKAKAHLNHMQYTINAVDMRTVNKDKVQAVYDILFTGDDK